MAVILPFIELFATVFCLLRMVWTSEWAPKQTDRIKDINDFSIFTLHFFNEIPEFSIIVIEISVDLGITQMHRECFWSEIKIEIL